MIDHKVTGSELEIDEGPRPIPRYLNVNKNMVEVKFTIILKINFRKRLIDTHYYQRMNLN